LKTEKFPVVLDKTRFLAYDLNAFCHLESKFGHLTKALEQMQSGSFTAIRAFLWAGLVHEEESLTEQEVGSWITPHNLETVAERIVEAIQASLPEEKKNQPST
jgi:hypothetical protein